MIKQGYKIYAPKSTDIYKKEYQKFVIVNDMDSVLFSNIGCDIDCIDNKIVEEIKSFGKLEKGWDFELGLPASKATISYAIDLYNQTSCHPYICDLKINVMPCSDGGIMFSYSRSDDFIIIQIHPNLTYDITHEKGIGSDYDILKEEEELDINDKSTILTYLYSICNLLESSLIESTIMTARDLAVIASPTTGAVSLSSMRNAHWQKATQSVPTLKNFTLELQEYL